MTDRKPTATNAVPSQDTDGVPVRHVPGPCPRPKLCRSRRPSL